MKICEIMTCMCNISQQVISDHQNPLSQVNIPTVQIINDDFTEDQETPECLSLPLSDDLIFMKYADGGECEDPGKASDHQFFASEDDDIVHGFVFYYPSLNMTKMIEMQVRCEQDRIDIQTF